MEPLVLITGAAGQVGSEILALLRQRGIPVQGLDHTMMDLADLDSVRRCLEKREFTHLVHCAAYTAVDRAESEPELCRRINAEATALLAGECARRHAAMLYFSTDYVYPGEGSSPLTEDSPTGPRNVYGQTKLEGERSVSLLPRHYILRTSWIFGNGNNFVRTMLRLGRERGTVSVVCDQIGSPTYAADLAEAAALLLFSGLYGAYHCTNEGTCSWLEFAQEIFRVSGIPAEVLPVRTKDYPAAAQRPFNSRLSKDKWAAAGFPRLPAWQDALKRYWMRLQTESPGEGKPQNHAGTPEMGNLDRS